MSLSRSRQICRINWAVIHSRDDYQKVLALRDSFPADFIQREVLAKHRRALVVYGDMHFQRKQMFSNDDMSSPIAQTIVSLLESGCSLLRDHSLPRMHPVIADDARGPARHASLIARSRTQVL